MHKSSKFLISDLMSEQISSDVLKNTCSIQQSDIRNQDISNNYNKNFLNPYVIPFGHQNEATTNNNIYQNSINDILYSQINNLIKLKTLKDNHNEICVNHGKNYGNTFHVLGNNFCSCISCQAIRYLNLVNQDLINKNQTNVKSENEFQNNVLPRNELKNTAESQADLIKKEAVFKDNKYSSIDAFQESNAKSEIQNEYRYKGIFLYLIN